MMSLKALRCFGLIGEARLGVFKSACDSDGGLHLAAQNTRGRALLASCRLSRLVIPRSLSSVSCVDMGWSPFGPACYVEV